VPKDSPKTISRRRFFLLRAPHLPRKEHATEVGTVFIASAVASGPG
jgi:hypothetical protein